MEKINLKNLLAVIAGLAIITPTTVGILSNVNTTNNKNSITSQEIIDEIHETFYEKNVEMGITYDKLKTEKITAKFIKSKLSDEIKDAFDDSKFFVVSIKNIKTNEVIDDEDLKNVKLIEAEIIYNYDDITNLTANLNIQIEVKAEDIVAEINAQTYKMKIGLGAKPKTVFEKVADINFIINNANVNDNVQESLSRHPMSYRLNDDGIINTKTNKVLTEDDLNTVDTINATISYNYDSFEDQTTKLTIEVTKSNKEIADAINEIKDYEVATPSGVTVEDFKKAISGDFIKAKLTGEIANAFNGEWFILLDLRLNGESLKDSDLEYPNSLKVKIIYTYDTVENQETSLTILISDPQEIN